jgi:Lamin Tail Domain
VRSTAIRCALAALLVGVVAAPGVLASPASDFDAVIKDYTRDQKVTPCLFTQAQLEAARTQLGPDVNAYAPGLSTAISREIKRWKDGDCTAKKVAAARGADVRIVKVKSKGGVKSESVTLRNYSGKSVNLRGYVLRDAGDHVIKFKKTTLKAKRSVVVVTGCRKGTKKAVRKGSRYYACRSKEFWDDAGDIVQLVNPKGGLLSQKTYGTAPTG